MQGALDRYFTLQAEYLGSLADFYRIAQDDLGTRRHALDGAIKMVDALALVDRLNLTRPRRILEIGSFLGFSTRWMLEASAEWDAVVTSVDPGLRHRTFDQPNVHLQRFCGPFGERLRTTQACLSDKNEAMFIHDYLIYQPVLSPRAALAIIDAVPLITEPFGEFDFAFIDGDHGFEATQANVRLVARMMPQGGVIVVHDAFSWPGVMAGVHDLCAHEDKLEFGGVDGTAFHLGCDLRARLTGQDAQVWKSPFADGLAVVLVKPSDAKAGGWLRRA